jgi:hypothetical protein
VHVNGELHFLGVAHPDRHAGDVVGELGGVVQVEEQTVRLALRLAGQALTALCRLLIEVTETGERLSKLA